MSDKIHPPTPRRRQKAKEQGRGPRSKELVSAGSLLALAGLLSWMGNDLGQGLMRSLEQSLGSGATLSIDTDGATRLIVKAVVAAGLLVVPMLLGMLACGVGMNLVQTGWMFLPNRLSPSPQRLMPGQRVGELMSLAALGRFGVLVAKVIAVFAVAATVSRSNLPDLIAVTGLPLAAIARQIFQTLIECCVWVGLTLLIFAGVDFALAWWQHERELMMTEQELRDEMRDNQGAKAAQASARAQKVQGIG